MVKLIVKKSKISGLGLFTDEDIGWGKKIIEYIGEKIKTAEGDRRSKFYDKIGVNYLFELDDKNDIDGLVGGNESRFINHSSKNFNCVPIRENGRIYIHAYRDIEKGEELLFDYGDTFTFKRNAKVD